MSLFWIDKKRDVRKTYGELIDDLNEKNSSHKYIYLDDPYQIFLELVFGIASGRDLKLLDSDFSNMELEKLDIDFKGKTTGESVGEIEVQDFAGLMKKIRSSKCKISMFTSGTTGTPKEITHSLDSMTRGVKVEDRFEDNVWAFAYNPTHIAGLQVFFQAFFNQNPMVNIFDLKKKNVSKVFADYDITNISATPTFYRTKLSHLSENTDSVKGVTFGGEKLDPITKDKMREVFPNAKFRNIYASTEAGSLFGSRGETFEISEDQRPYINISDEDELLVHKELLGDSDDYNLDGEWYHSGDIVEQVADNKFKFVSRKTEEINVGGYQVNPHEVEEQIMKLGGVNEVLVQGRENKVTGNILTAQVVKENEVSGDQLKEKIKDNLSDKLQRWKVPRIINFVSDIEKSRTGKKSRT